ncbi:hypothetical protein OROMI_031034 [Orobanche minor]
MEIAQQALKMKGTTDVVFVRCDCCGLTEECTEEYIKRIRDRYSGRWICGLCAEAVKDEIVRSGKGVIDTEEALNQHMSFCRKFKARSAPKNSTEELIAAVKHLLLRSLETSRSSPVSKPGMTRSQSCHPALDSGCLRTN